MSHQHSRIRITAGAITIDLTADAGIVVEPVAAPSAPRRHAPPELRDGEHYVGVFFDDDGVARHHLILLPGDERKQWQDAKAWAAGRGGELPTRLEAGLMYRRCQARFQCDWYWTCEQHAVDPSYAWIQSFDWGGQDGYRVDDDFRCRAVRRAPIQPFADSPIPA